MPRITLTNSSSPAFITKCPIKTDQIKRKLRQREATIIKKESSSSFHYPHELNIFEYISSDFFYLPRLQDENILSKLTSLFLTNNAFWTHFVHQLLNYLINSLIGKLNSLVIKTVKMESQFIFVTSKDSA